MNIDTEAIRKLASALLQSGSRPSEVLSSAYQTLTREGLLGSAELAALKRVDRVAETMFLMMAADGTLAPDEQVAIRGAVRGLSGDVLADGVIDVMLETYQRRLAEEGRDTRLQQIATRLSEDISSAEGAFALAAAVAVADKQVDATETDLIHRLAGWFGISTERAAAILGQLEEAPR